MQAKALWYVAPGRVELREEAVAEPAAGEVRVRALFGAISRALSASSATAGCRRANSSACGRRLWGRVSVSGEIWLCDGRTGRGRAGRAANLIVFALHPHQSLFTIPADKVIPVPAGVPPQRAVLAANMETALNALWDGAPGPADRIAVVGGGVVGLLAARLAARLPGAEVTVVDIAPARAEFARALGAGFATPDAAPGDCDLVFHASATAAGLATALWLAGRRRALSS